MSEEVLINDHAFDWCASNQHDRCTREYRKWVMEKNKVVYTGERVVCLCKKRGCPCYVRPADRTVAKKATRKRRKQ